jgi:hypothetical protein
MTIHIHYSLKVTVKGIDVATIKTFDVPSYIEFYTTGDNFNFYINGVQPDFIGSSDTENWKKWIYAIPPGTHVFKWKPTSPDKLNLDAIKFAASGLPEVHTEEIIRFDPFSVTANYMLLSNGNHVITAHGVCWGTTSNPTIEDNRTINTESILGNYTSLIEDLDLNTTYYVRAYADNGVGVVYGEEPSFKTQKALIGDFYQGGIVAYIDETGERGLIAAPEDLGTAIWGWNHDIATGATGTAIGTGKSNTTTIVQALVPGNYAAKLCYDLVLNGYDDWYLPSVEELNLLWRNIGVTGLEVFLDTSYWTSSQQSRIYTYIGKFEGTDRFKNAVDMGNLHDKASRCSARAIRQF